MLDPLLAACAVPIAAYYVYRRGYVDGFRAAPKPPAKTGVDARLAKQLAALGYSSYAAYLASAHWTAKKRAKKRSQGVVACAACGFRWNLILHHIKYVRLGRERLSDVVLLCSYCHTDTHTIAGRIKKLHVAHHRLIRQRRFHGLSTGPIS